ncbi:MAG: NAD(P)/FAD-dependent oxidoreductase, partial [Acidimicrobiaceae bacterium]|nr:NAD(P)/FAD-dependent oxidoreductase [Acidimicrobiaceae bacterium]
MNRRVAERAGVLVVGNGMATDRLLDELDARGALQRLGVTVVGEEPFGSYNRMLLSRVLAGGHPDTITTKPLDWFAEHGVRLLAARRVQRLEVAAHLAHIGDGETIAYRTAVIATGSAPLLPPIAGLTDGGGRRTPGVHVMRSMEDVLQLRDDLGAHHDVRDAVIVGGGLLGLEAAKASRDLGHRATVIHPFPHLMESQLDETGGGLLRAAMVGLGIDVVVGKLEAVLARHGESRPGRVEALRLEDGRLLPADAVVVTTGVRPRVEVARDSGIETNYGIVVDDRLATSAPGVHAIGECAQHRGVTFGFAAPCWDHAAVLADLLAGTDPAARYGGTATYSRLKVAGIDVASLGGAVTADADDDVLEVLERRRGVYRKLVVRHHRLVGAILVGDASQAPSLIRLLDRGEPLPENPLDLFCSSDAYRDDQTAGGTLCACNRVGEGAVVEAIAAGHDTVEQIGAATRA